MLFFHKELKEKLKSNYQIQKAVQDGLYFKLEEGIYSDEKNVNYLTVINKKYPYGIIYGESAYYYYNLTDFVPSKFILATNKNSKIRTKHIKQVRMKDELFNLGKCKIILENVQVTIYDKERMLLELAKNKNRMGYDLYKEIISNYRKIADELDMEKIESYLPYYPNENKLFEIIQDEVF